MGTPESQSRMHQTLLSWRPFVRKVPLALLLATAALAFAGYRWWTRPRPPPSTEVFRGVTYTCIDVNQPDCVGLVHLVKVDLKAPSVQLYLTPLDPEAISHGY